MKVDRSITCTNQNNISCLFKEGVFSPFLLEKAEGLYEMSAGINTSDNGVMDGATYHSSFLKKRNIVLYLRDLNNFKSNREFLNELFIPKSKGTLYFQEEDEERVISYYVEHVTSNGTGYARIYQVSLICPDPYFYDRYDTQITMAAFLPSFTFPHRFKKSGEELGYQQKNKLQQIMNKTGTDNIGMTIEIRCNGAVQNPSVIRVESNEHIRIGAATKPLNLVAGDRVIITTEDGGKQVTLHHAGTQEKINNYLSEDSTFLQLQRGSNSIGYSADAGVDNIVITIRYKIRYASA